MNRIARIGLAAVIISGLLLSMLSLSGLQVSAQVPTLPPLPEVPGAPTLPGGNPTSIPTLHLGDYWVVEIDLPLGRQELIAMGGASNAALQLENGMLEALANAPGPKVTVGVSIKPNPNGSTLYTLTLEGHNVDLMREVLYVLIVPLVDVLSLPISITIIGDARSGNSMRFDLTGIASTGYAWALDNMGGLAEVDEEESGYDCEAAAPGAPLNQALVAKFLKDGELALRLAYRRLWEEFEEPMVRITIYPSAGLGGSLLLGHPNPDSFVGAEPPVSGEPDPSLGAGGVPASYNWASTNNRLGRNIMTGVRNQNSCGSCWAFASVGVLEGVVQMNNGPSSNLSEQYLVSCNQDGWGCSGGWWAHDYHISKWGSNSNQPGSVSEVDMPYSSSDGTCKTISQHTYLLSNWRSAGNEKLESVDTIKAAIYQYGPVAAAVCASGSFQSYTGGVYTKDECNQVNHAIILTGWDDATQSWVLRNSWGSGWGEGGYMRIRWGVQAVGYGANYVEYAGGSNNNPPTNTPTKTGTATTTGTTTATATTTTTGTVTTTGTTTTTATITTTGTQTATGTTTATVTSTPQGGQVNTSTNTPQGGQVNTSTPVPGAPSNTPQGGQVNTSTPVPGAPSNTPQGGQANTSTPVPGAPSNTPQGGQVNSATPDPQNNSGDPSPTPFGLRPGFYEETAIGLVYEGDWVLFNGSGPHAENTYYTYRMGSSASFGFSGSQFSLGYTAFPGAGVVQVWVDGHLTATFNQYNPVFEWQQVWDSPTLANGNHVVTIQHVYGGQVDIDFVEVR